MYMFGPVIGLVKLLGTGTADATEKRASDGTSAHVTVEAHRVVNVNTATEQQLAFLPGVGSTTARRIVAYRERRKFGKPAHLMRVKGIGRKTFLRLKPYIVIKGETTAQGKIHPAK